MRSPKERSSSFSASGVFIPRLGAFAFLRVWGVSPNSTDMWRLLQKSEVDVDLTRLRQSFSSFERVLSIQCWAALDPGAGVDQPLECFVIQTVRPCEVDGLRQCYVMTKEKIPGTQNHMRYD